MSTTTKIRDEDVKVGTVISHLGRNYTVIRIDSRPNDPHADLGVFATAVAAGVYTDHEWTITLVHGGTTEVVR